MSWKRRSPAANRRRRHRIEMGACSHAQKKSLLQHDLGHEPAKARLLARISFVARIRF